MKRAGSVGSVGEPGLVAEVDFLDVPLHAATVASNNTEAKRMFEMYTIRWRFNTASNAVAHRRTNDSILRHAVLKESHGRKR